MAWGHKQGNTSATASVTLNGVTAGDLLVLLIRSNGTISSVSGGGTWAHVSGFPSNTYAGEQLDAWYCASATGGSTTVTLTPGTATSYSTDLEEFSTPGGTISVDATGSHGGYNGSTSFRTGSLTSTNASDLIVGAISNSYGSVSGVKVNGASGPTKLSSPAVSHGLQAAYEVVSSTGSYQFTFTTTTTSPGVSYDGGIVAFKSAGGGGTAITVGLPIPVEYQAARSFADIVPFELARALIADSRAALESLGGVQRRAPIASEALRRRRIAGVIPVESGAALVSHFPAVVPVEWSSAAGFLNLCVLESTRANGFTSVVAVESVLRRLAAFVSPHEALGAHFATAPVGIEALGVTGGGLLVPLESGGILTVTSRGLGPTEWSAARTVGHPVGSESLGPGRFIAALTSEALSGRRVGFDVPLASAVRRLLASPLALEATGLLAFESVVPLVGAVLTFPNDAAPIYLTVVAWMPAAIVTQPTDAVTVLEPVPSPVVIENECPVTVIAALMETTVVSPNTDVIVVQPDDDVTVI